MRYPKQVGNRPRPWPLPRLQGMIGNRAVDDLLKPPPHPPPLPHEAEPPEPQPPRRRWFWLLPVAGMMVGGALGYAVEQTPAASYAGPAFGALLGLVSLLWPVLTMWKRRE